MDIASLTVPQLKARCKELKLTGYSKLSRVALLQKLGHSADTPSVSALTPPAFNKEGLPSISQDNNNLKHASPVSPVVEEDGPAMSSSGAKLGASSLEEGPHTLQSYPVQGPGSTKRKNDISLDVSHKKLKLPEAPVAAKELSAQHKLQDSYPSISTSLSRAKTPSTTALAQMKAPKSIASGSVTHNRLSKPRSTRFLPLVSSQAATIRHLSANRPRSTDANSAAKLRYLDFEHAKIPSASLPAIGFPPSLKQRDSVQMWAIALRLLTDEDRRQCVLVSRTIRYAVYLSATHVIKHNFGSRRLHILTQYSQHIQNFWPILLYLRADMSRKKQVYQTTFLSSFFASQDPIAGRIWDCVDHDDQLTVAMRYLVTRIWSCFCINGADKEKLKRTVVVDAQEIVQGEIWLIVTDSMIAEGKRSREYFHVLYETCEVIGIPSPPEAEEHVSESRGDMRPDWSLYASSHEQTRSSEGSLLARVKWNNEEEYLTGMSRYWLSRIKGEGAVGEYKRKVGARYVLASVVCNSISGTWMTSSHMAQVFAGRASENDVVPRRPKVQKVGFFLPAHHLVESVHFKLGSGLAFHPAIACVRTPDREYYILRDNGMTIGCEEDGIWEKWTGLLGCDEKGMRV